MYFLQDLSFGELVPLTHPAEVLESRIAMQVCRWFEGGVTERSFGQKSEGILYFLSQNQTLTPT